MTPCRRVRNDQLATLKQHGGRRRSPSGLWSICVSGDRCGDAVGFSVSTRRQCNGRGQAERDRQKIAAIPASASILARSWHWARAAPPTVAARTRIVSKARIRRDQRKSVRPFKGIFCDDISEFESSHPSQPVRLCGASAKRSSCLTFRESLSNSCLSASFPARLAVTLV
jgi:hypothetical protein